MPIDLRSDTVTKPTEEMRKAAYLAEVGDDVYREDPTIRKLEETAADILGKESALFVTSGTQGNQVSVLTHCHPGNEIILEEESHIFYYESGAVAALAGVQTKTLPGNRGAMDPRQVESSIRSIDQHFPETGLICIENTHNRAGGAIVPIENIHDIYTIAKRKQVPVHMDGARLFNAAAASQKSAKDFAQYCDSVQICLSKGLGAPVGSVLAGSEEFIKSARKWRKRLGGGMRQAGILAAPGLVALTAMRDRLIVDHQNAQRFAEGIENIPRLSVSNKVDTNIVIVDISKTNLQADHFVEKLKKDGVLAGTFSHSHIRFVTHFEISKEDIETALHLIANLFR